jgi:hypothetical protein
MPFAQTTSPARSRLRRRFPAQFHRQHPAWREQAGMRGNFAISVRSSGPPSARGEDRNRGPQAAGRRSPRAPRRVETRTSTGPLRAPRNRTPRTTHGRRPSAAATVARGRRGDADIRADRKRQAVREQCQQQRGPVRGRRCAARARCSPARAANATSTTVSVPGRGGGASHC